MRIYNTLSRRVEEFKPIKAGEVKLYTCGPTVYDHVHIGNLRTYIFEDILRRVLISNNFQVQHVMNITDVDDKTILRSKQEFPGEKPKQALGKLTRKYEELFYEDAYKVGIDFSHSKIIRATNHINDMRELIRRIPYKYTSDDGIYFDISQDKNYGTLVKLDRTHEHHRINNDEYDKDHVADFALWKTAEKDEPSWEFGIDGKNIAGRPGWHIECSAMSVKYLGQPFDIHTGGVDLIFPHHENEIAQSRAAINKPLANYFVHSEHLLVDGHKMSKTRANFYTLDNILTKGFDPLAFRVLTLQAHYRSQLNFTWESLDAAQSFLKRLQAWADLKFQPALGHKSNAGHNYDTVFKKLVRALSEDLNTAEALAEISKLVTQAESEGVVIEKLQPMLKKLDQALGLGLANRKDVSPQIKKLIFRREQARKNQNWSEADHLRDELANQGIDINDTPHGPVWSRA
ncbi:cysteine--tRNA ligase [Candidatus Saccharibacteria bacterium]|nr:cysteine--tRNA ligase [Candidatus Saccharibacteria bacterium]